MIGALLAGTGLALYRNDVLLDLARQNGMEERYLRWERSALGAPGWGTPRSVVPATELLASPRGSGEESATLARDTSSSGTSAATAPAAGASDVPSRGAEVEESTAKAKAEVPIAALEPSPKVPSPGAVTRQASSSSFASAVERPSRATPSRVERSEQVAWSERATSSGRSVETRARSKKPVEDDDEVVIEEITPPKKSREERAREERAAREESERPSRSEKIAKAEKPPKAEKAPKAAPPPAPAADDNPLNAAIRASILKDQGN